MARVLIVSSSREGQTRRIVQSIEDRIRKAGHQLETVNADDLPRGWIFSKADAVLVAASIHIGRYTAGLRELLKKDSGRLSALPSAFLSVCLSAADPAKKSEAEGYIEQLVADTGWKPTITASIAGALRYPEYSFPKRWMMQKIAAKGGLPTDTSRVHEFTDWEEVRAFADRVMELATGGVPQHA